MIMNEKAARINYLAIELLAENPQCVPRVDNDMAAEYRDPVRATWRTSGSRSLADASIRIA